MLSHIAELRVQVQRCERPDRPRSAQYPAALAGTSWRSLGRPVLPVVVSPRSLGASGHRPG
jgi:hypothetical protein